MPHKKPYYISALLVMRSSISGYSLRTTQLELVQKERQKGNEGEKTNLPVDFSFLKLYLLSKTSKKFGLYSIVQVSVLLRGLFVSSSNWLVGGLGGFYKKNRVITSVLVLEL